MVCCSKAYISVYLTHISPFWDLGKQYRTRCLIGIYTVYLYEFPFEIDLKWKKKRPLDEKWTHPINPAINKAGVVH